MIYKYFVSYSFRNSEFSGFGNTEIRSKKIMDNIEVIREITEVIRKDGGAETVIIMNFILLSKENEGHINE